MDGSLPGSWSMGFSRQDYWSGLPFPSLGDLPNPGIEPGPPALQTDALPSEPLGKPLTLETSRGGGGGRKEFLCLINLLKADTLAVTGI